MAQTIEYWRPTTNSYHPAAPGIEVLTNDTGWAAFGLVFPAGFRAAVHDALSWLNQTPSGAVLLLELENNPNDTGITPGLAGNQARMNNPNASLTQVANEILVGGAPGAQTRAAAIATFGGVLGTLHAAAHGLAAAINSTPRWTLNAMPGLGGWGTRLQNVRNYVNQWALLIDPRYFRWADTNEGYRIDQTWFRTLGVTSFDVGITPTQTHTWLTTGALPGGLTVDQQNHIHLSTIAALDAQAARGPGSDSAVSWNIDPNVELNRRRPPAIGLGHELVHAYYGVRGQQPGFELPLTLSVELFEYRCVGLGPWDGAVPSENSLRQEWWPNTSHLIPGTDTLNRKVPPKRIMYD